MRIKIISLGMLIGCILILVGCGQKQPQTKIPKADADHLTITTQYHKNKQNIELLHNFLKDSMVQKAGIYTNFNNNQKKSDNATGHDMLSESSGLWLEYWRKLIKIRLFGSSTKIPRNILIKVGNLVIASMVRLRESPM